MKLSKIASICLIGLCSINIASANDKQNLGEVTVEELVESPLSYKAKKASSAMMVSVPLKETPFNVGVIKESLMDDLQVDSLEDAILLNAAVKRSHGHSKNVVQYNIRGFSLDADRLGYLVNGVPVAATDAPPAHESALERIEVLKGSAALYYGAGEPAGVINYIYKEPQAKEQYSFKTTIGQYDKKSLELDATGKVGDTEELLYRFTLGLEDSQGVVDYDYSKDIAPTLQLLWQPTDETSLKLTSEYIKHEGNPISSDTVWLGDRWHEGPKNQYLGFSSDYEEQTSKGIQLHLDHNFSNNLKLIVQSGWKDGGKKAGNSGYFIPITHPLLGTDAVNGIFPRAAFDQKRESETKYIAAHVEYDLETDLMKHKFLAGVNYSKAETYNVGYFNSVIAAFADPSRFFTLPPNVDINNPTNPNYNHNTNFESSPPFYRDRWYYDNIGFNLQDHISIPSANLHVLLGLRYTKSGGKFTEAVDEDGSIDTQNLERDADESKLLPRVGLVYDINDNHNIFASYSESFKPPMGVSRDTNGNLIETPETSYQYEMGWRGSFLNDKLSTTLALYELTKENVAVATGIPNVSEVAGEQRSRGIELDIIGNITDDWNMYLSYAYTDTEVIDAGTASNTKGDPFPGVPKHKLVLHNTYDLETLTGINGLKFGYGFDYQSAAYMNVYDITLQQTLTKVPKQGFIHNANISYETRINKADVEFNLGVKNLTDEFYVKNNATALFAKKGDRRSINFTISAKF